MRWAAAGARQAARQPNAPKQIYIQFGFSTCVQMRIVFSDTKKLVLKVAPKNRTFAKGVVSQIGQALRIASLIAF